VRRFDPARVVGHHRIGGNQDGAAPERVADPVRGVVAEPVRQHAGVGQLGDTAHAASLQRVRLTGHAVGSGSAPGTAQRLVRAGLFFEGGDAGGALGPHRRQVPARQVGAHVDRQLGKQLRKLRAPLRPRRLPFRGQPAPRPLASHVDVIERPHEQQLLAQLQPLLANPPVQRCYLPNRHRSPGTGSLRRPCETLCVPARADDQRSAGRPVFRP